MMRVPALTVLALLAVLAPACKSHKKSIAVDTSEVGDIPREAALQKLRDLLPTADYVYCTLPKESLKPSEIRGWKVGNDAIEIDFGKSKALSLVYLEITQVRLEQNGRYYAAHVSTTAQPEKEHFQFLWKQEGPAKNVVELLASLKKK
jgi:hypothetical protein